MIKVIGIILVIIGVIVQCCFIVGARADKDIEKLELERPDLIQLSKKNA